MTEMQYPYRSLASDNDREALAADIRRVRQEVVRLISLVPQDKWYEARYHGWSLGAMLGHLHFMDNVTLRMMQAAARGITFPLPKGGLNLLNNNVTRWLKQQPVETTVRQMQANEARLIDFVLHLPARQFVRRVYDPWLERYLTLEEAVQEFFLIHWQTHLQTIRLVEDMGFYEPSASSSNLL